MGVRRVAYLVSNRSRIETEMKIVEDISYNKVRSRMPINQSRVSVELGSRVDR